MMTLIIGGSGSGKSAFAEQELSKLKDVERNYYLAAMQVFDEEGRKRVERHKALRQGKGFLTLEQPTEIARAAERMVPGRNAALLECMSNLTANEMFGETMRTAEETAELVLGGVEALNRQLCHLVIVTNNVFEDGIRYDDSTMEYLRALGSINRSLAVRADRVVEVVVGLPLIIKE